MTAERTVKAIGLAAAALFLGAGGWALIDPASFYERVATYPPYNRHFLHDIGAFQIGLGVALVLALRSGPGAVVGLGGAAAGSVAHALAHVVDRDLGGRPGDPILLGLVAAALVVAAALAYRSPTKES